MHQPVRPTHRALEDLGIAFPRLTVRLGEVDHPLVRKAQDTPAEVAAGGAERIRSLTDRTWFKVKVEEHRGASGEVESQGGNEVPPRGWWLVAAGQRQSDTPSRDFYARLEAECQRAGTGTGKVNSINLLPADIDYRRWKAELATLAVTALQDLVRQAVVRSAHDGKLWQVTVQNHVVGALVHSSNAVTYVAITAEGYYDHRLVAVLLASVPGVPADDWLAEPGAVLGIQPATGQVIFSTILPPAILAVLLEEDDGTYL
jgi:hypothetical protein